MATGRLSAVDVGQLTEQVIYQTDGTDPGNTATVSINICNRSSTESTIFSLAVTDDGTLGDDLNAMVLEHGMVLEPNGVFERTGVFVGAGQSVVIRTDTGNISAVVMGAEVQQVSSALPAATNYTIPITYVVSSDVSSINEGNSVNFIVRTTGISDGTTLGYTLSGVVSSDINGASLTGNITINNNVGILTVTSTADNTTEGDETLTFTLDINNAVVNVTLLDTSLDPVTPPEPESSIPEPALWYKNSWLSDNVSNGSNSYAWLNEGSYGTNYNLTSGGNGSRPTKYTNNQGGTSYAYVDFSGNRTLRFSNGTNIRMFNSSQQNAFTMFIVYYDAYGSNSFGWLGNVNGGPGTLGEWSGDDSFYHIHNNDGRPFNFSLAGNSDSFNQHGVRYSSPGSTNGYVYRWIGNTGSIDTVTSNWGTYGSDLDIYGIGYSRYSYNQGYMYEFIYYDRSLTNDEVAQVRQYLANTFPNTNVAS